MKPFHVHTNWIDEDVVAKLDRYSNGALALQLLTPSGERVCVASVNILSEAHRLGPNQTFIKSWSENEGLLEALQAAKIIGPVLFEVQTGFVTAHAIEVLVKE